TTVAWLTARASWYTITDQRVVMRIGIVLEVTYNFPFKVIDEVGLRMYADGTGDLPLCFMPGEQIAYVHLWPHAKPWHVRRTQPMMRCVPDAANVAALLSRAMATRTGGSALPIQAGAAADHGPVGQEQAHGTTSAA
ncbi:MAG: photosynthetic complex putative assembly protein PuhB, partial [Dokdonella sp.]